MKLKLFTKLLLSAVAFTAAQTQQCSSTDANCPSIPETTANFSWFKTIFRVLFDSWPELRIALRRTITGSSEERGVGVLSTVMLDPHVLQKLYHDVEGDYKYIADGKALLPRDFDLFIRASTEVGHRGDAPAVLFNRWFPFSCLNAKPKRYGKCPFGAWEDMKDVEPHFMARNDYEAQIPEMENNIDRYMQSYVGKEIEIGDLTRSLVWDVYCASVYGTTPGDEKTMEMLQVFEDHYAEFNYAVLMSGKSIDYKWSDDLEKQVGDIGEYFSSIAKERKANIEQYKDKTDILTRSIIDHPEMDELRMEGSLRGGFTGGINNMHSAITGSLIWNAQHDDEVYDYYMKDPGTNVEYIMREGLRLFNSIPATREVLPEDNFIVDGKKVPTGTKLFLSTYGINTDPRSWDKPLEYSPSRFEGKEDIAYMTTRGFVPYGIGAEIGGRPCSARFYNSHLIRVVVGKLLRDYKFVYVSGKGFEFKQNSATSRYAGDCRVKVEKRV